MEDDINLKLIILKIFQNKKSLFSYCFLGVIFSAIIAFSTKKTWQGSFQIVLENNAKISGSQGLLSSINPNIAELAGSQNTKQLRTEVAILKSPSVLMEIFDYVKAEKIDTNKKYKNLRFKDWSRQNLDINLEKGTTILNLSYRDNDKNLIIPVLNKISSAYQSYSGKKRIRGIDLSLDYFKDQLEVYEKRSLESTKLASKYGIKYDLGVVDIKKDAINNIRVVTNIEKNRLEAVNNLRLINDKLEKLKNLKNDSDQILLIALQIPELSEEGFSKKIKEIDSNLVKLSLYLKENDRQIKYLKKEKIANLKFLKKDLIDLLNVEKNNAISLLNASRRPDGVLIKYKQLINESIKDKSVLDNLGNQFRALSLEKSKIEDPWELITKPTLFPFPIAPVKRMYVLTGFFIGAILGSLIIIYKDSKKNIVYLKQELESITRSPLLGELTFENHNKWEEDIVNIFKSIPFTKNKSFALLYVGDFREVEFEYIKDIFYKTKEIKNIYFTNVLNDINESQKIIIISKLGNVKRSFLRKQCSYIFKKNHIEGSIAIK